VLEHVGQLLLVTHLDDRLGAVALVDLLEPEGNGVDVAPWTVSDPEQRQARRGTDPVDRPRHRKRLRALSFGVSRGACILDARDDRDPVAFGDGLAESSLAA